MAVEPVRDYDSVGHGCGAAGHGDSQDGEQKIKLPQAAADPTSRTQDQTVEEREGEDDALSSETIDDHAGAGNQERSNDIEEGKD